MLGRFTTGKDSGEHGLRLVESLPLLLSHKTDLKYGVPISMAWCGLVSVHGHRDDLALGCVWVAMATQAAPRDTMTGTQVR